MLNLVDVVSELEQVAAAAARFAAPGETVTAVVAAEPSPDRRTYLCAFDGPAGRTWLALDDAGAPVTSRDRVREAISIAAVCEVAEETSGDDVGDVVRVASPAYIDQLAAEQGPGVAGAFSDAVAIAEELAREVESRYKLALT
jgi:hypothetical protein